MVWSGYTFPGGVPMHRHAFLVLTSCLAVGCGDDDDPNTTPSGGSPTNATTFFVSSTRSTTGDLGGLQGADARCQGLAAAAGMGNRTWRAYLSVERDPGNGNRSTDARSRIGTGPSWNSSHSNMSCADTAPRGGAGRIYCFAVN